MGQDFCAAGFSYRLPADTYAVCPWRNVRRPVMPNAALICVNTSQSQVLLLRPNQLF
jgi:hypothetical protein